MEHVDLDPHDEALGRAVVARREELQISRPDLARASTLSYPYIYEIERGRKSPSENALDLIASSLEITPTALLERAKDYLPESVVEAQAAARADTEEPPSQLDELTDRVMNAVRPAVRAAIAEALGQR